MSFFSNLWKKIKSFFGFEDSTNPQIEPPKVEEPVETDPVETEPVNPPVEERDPVLDKATKIAIIVGHNEKSQGATNYKGESEFKFNSRIAEKIKSFMAEKYPNKKVKIFFRDTGYYSTAVKKVGQDVGKWKAKISMELHFNSFKNVAYGCEILIWDRAKEFEKTREIADLITDELAAKFNLKERNRSGDADGVKVLGSKDRGALNVKACNDAGVKHAMLIEPCFANIEHGESKAIFENEDAYAELLADELAKISA